MEREYEFDVGKISDTARTRQTVSYVSDISKLSRLSPSKKVALKMVQELYPFRANDYYLSLINWSDPNDPIFKIIIPDETELSPHGHFDPSDEKSVTVVQGCEHKYANTAVLLCNDMCGGFCRFCFRKRLFQQGNEDSRRDISPGLAYISEHPEIDNVLLSGGDPLLLSTKRLAGIFARITAIPHVQIIRIGTKMPAFNPFRVTDDPELLDLLNEVNGANCQIYMMVQFNHPREITEEAIEAVWRMREAGCRVHNQTPLLAGINDEPEVICELANRLSYIGVTPYYVFQNRPVVGNAAFSVPIIKGLKIIESAKAGMSGLAKTLRYAMSHRLGKIEILGTDSGRVFFKFHQSKVSGLTGKLFGCPADESACWLDDFELPDFLNAAAAV